MIWKFFRQSLFPLPCEFVFGKFSHVLDQRRVKNWSWVHWFWPKTFLSNFYIRSKILYRFLTWFFIKKSKHKSKSISFKINFVNNNSITHKSSRAKFVCTIQEFFTESLSLLCSYAVAATSCSKLLKKWNFGTSRTYFCFSLFKALVFNWWVT